MLTCQVDRDLPVTVLRLGGELRLETVGEVRAALLRCLAECPATVIVDLSAVAIDPPITLSVFGAVARRTALWPPARMVLVAGPSPVRTLVEPAARRWQLPVCGSLAEALAITALAPPPLQRVRRTFRPATTALAQARAMVARACRSWGVAGLAMPAELVLSELVSNAVEHARTDLETRVVLSGDLLHLTVADGSPDPPRIRPAPHPVTAMNGRGLLLVDEFSTTWGHLPIGGGKVVWATLNV